MIIIRSPSLAEAVGEGRESEQERGRVGNLGIYSTTAVKPLEYEDEYRALEQNLNLTM